MMLKRWLFLVIPMVLLSSSIRAQEVVEDSLDAYHVFIFDVIASLNEGNFDPFINAFDLDSLINIVFSDVPLPEYDARSMKMGMKTGIREQFRVVFPQLITETDIVEYVHYYEEESYYAILIRVSGDNGLNYLELQLSRDADDEIKIIDYFPYLSGEYASTTLNRTVKALISENSMYASVLELLTSKDKLYSRYLPELQKMVSLTVQGRFAEVKEMYLNIPEEIRYEKIFVLNALKAAQNLDDDFYISLLEEYQKRYPDDPSLPLITIDFYLLRGDFDEAYNQIDKLDELVGGDNFLNIMRATVALVKQDSEAQRKYLDIALENNMYRYEAYWMLVDLDVAEGNYRAAIESLDILSNIFGYRFDKTEFEDDLYAEFILSDEFQTWVPVTDF